LATLAAEHGVECAAVGSQDFSVMHWSFPEPSEFHALGVKAVRDEGGVPTIDCGYPVQLLENFPRALERFIVNFQPDIVWAQMEGARLIFERARKNRIRSLFFVRDAEFEPAELKSIARLGVHFVCNSQFLAGKVRQTTGRQASVVYPSLDASYGVDGDPGGYITMINPHRVKGVETFLAIAARLPSEKFLLLESWKLDETALVALTEKLVRLPNVRFIRRVADMPSIYGQTKLLLVPSVWEEAFGRVAIEAQSCKIPVVASARGGLPEAVGDGGILIDDYLDAEVWVQTIQQLLKDKAAYDGLSRKAYAHATQGAFSTAASARRFLEICSGILEGAQRPPPSRRFLAQFAGIARRFRS